ncbi:MAG: MGMT family protein [Ktedonobacteraceae bacterium]
MQEEVGQVTHLFIKPGHGRPMEPCSSIDVRAGSGIQRDVNARAMSPRHILLVRQEDLDAFAIAPGALRENVALAGLPPEVFVPGSLLTIGPTVAIRATFLCEACKRIAHVVPSLKSIADKRGLLGVILSDGVIEGGDRVSVQNEQFPPLSDIPYRRFLDVVASIPPGQVVTYRQVVIGMGVAESYMRAIPMYIRRTPAAIYPLHRILDTEGQVIPYVPDQQQRLADEGVEPIQASALFDAPTQARIPLERYLWCDPTLYLS